MLETFITALETSPPAITLRTSLWVYPVVNAGHILGIALLVGAIVPLDLRLLGLWANIPLQPLLQVLTTTSAVGLALAVLCGSLLFIAQAGAYGSSSLFVAKMAAVAIGLFNGLVMRTAISATPPPRWVAEGRLPAAVRLSALLSLMAWITALLLGRFIGYFS